MRRRFRAHTMQIGLAGLALGVAIVLAAMILFEPGTAAAAPQLQDGKPSDESCLACHQQEGMTAQIGGQPLHITIDGTKFDASVHGQEKVACVDCHTNSRHRYL